MNGNPDTGLTGRAALRKLLLLGKMVEGVAPTFEVPQGDPLYYSMPDSGQMLQILSAIVEQHRDVLERLLNAAQGGGK